jgi:hypothetical protein
MARRALPLGLKIANSRLKAERASLPPATSDLASPFRLRYRLPLKRGHRLGLGRCGILNLAPLCNHSLGESNG